MTMIIFVPLWLAVTTATTTSYEGQPATRLGNSSPPDEHPASTHSSHSTQYTHPVNSTSHNAEITYDFVDVCMDTGLLANYSEIHKLHRLDCMAEMVMLVAPPVILTFGTVCNALTIAVFTRPSLNESTASLLLIILAVSDTVALNMGAWVQWIKAVFRWMRIDNAMEATSDLSCKIYNFLYNIVVAFSVWVLVVISVERLINIAFPFKAQRLCNRRSAAVVLSIAFMVVTMLYIPVPISYEIIRGFGAKEADVNIALTGCGSVNLTDFWIDTFFRVLIPFILMFIANFTMIIILYCSHKKRESIAGKESYAFEARQLKLLTALLLSASFSHLVLCLPNIIYFLPYILHHFGYYTDDDLASQAGNQHLWWAIVTCLIYLDQSVNFLLYCISGRLIRTEVLKMLGCKKNSSYFIPPEQNTHHTPIKNNVSI